MEEPFTEEGKNQIETVYCQGKEVHLWPKDVQVEISRRELGRSGLECSGFHSR